MKITVINGEIFNNDCFLGRNSSTPEASEQNQKPQVKERKISKSSLLSKSPKKSVSKPVHNIDQEDEEDVYGGLDASKSVIIHGIESDWIEEEMSDDDDFRFGCNARIVITTEY